VIRLLDLKKPRLTIYTPKTARNTKTTLGHFTTIRIQENNQGNIPKPT